MKFVLHIEKQGNSYQKAIQDLLYLNRNCNLVAELEFNSIIVCIWEPKFS